MPNTRCQITLRHAIHTVFTGASESGVIPGQVQDPTLRRSRCAAPPPTRTACNSMRPPPLPVASAPIPPRPTRAQPSPALWICLDSSRMALPARPCSHPRLFNTAGKGGELLSDQIWSGSQSNFNSDRAPRPPLPLLAGVVAGGRFLPSEGSHFGVRRF